MYSKMISKFLIVTVVNSFIVVTFVQTDQNQHCSDLKSHMQSYNVDGFMKSVNDLWRSVYPNKEKTTLSEITQTALNNIFLNCSIPTKMNELLKRPPNADKKNKTEIAGSIDIRSVNETAGNFIMKLKYGTKRSSCASLRTMMKFLGTECLDELYGNEKIQAFALTFNTEKDPVINEWIALFYQRGDIVEARQHQAECLNSEEFKDLVYKDKHIEEYVKA